MSHDPSEIILIFAAQETFLTIINVETLCCFRFFYICVYIFICMCIYFCVCVCIYIYIIIYIYISFILDAINHLTALIYYIYIYIQIMHVYI